MQELLKRWEKTYYTELLLCCVLCIALIIAFRNRKKYKLLKYILVYIILLLIVFISDATLYLSNYLKHHQVLISGLVNYIDYFFTLVEMMTFSHFYYQLINNQIVKKIIIIANVFFILFFIYMAFIDKYFYQSISESTQSKVYTVEGVILLLICFIYFIELFKKPPCLNLKNEPVFWISTGLLFFLTCTLPFSILENYIKKNYIELIFPLYSIFYIFYILLFLMIIRAYLCKPEKTI